VSGSLSATTLFKELLGVRSVEERGKITTLFSLRGSVFVQTVGGAAKGRSLVTGKEKRPVFDDGTANSSAFLAALEGIGFGCEEVPGIQVAVAQESKKFP
jgi:hypothetical protein